MHEPCDACRNRWEQEVRERLEALDRYVIGTASSGGHYEERTIGAMHLMNSENANGEKGQWVKRSDVLAIFGAAEPESPAERVERLEAELVEAEAAVERKRQEDGP